MKNKIDKSSKKNKLKTVGLASICLALTTPFVFAGCANPEDSKGDRGADGESAFEIAKRYDPSLEGKTAEEWYASLKGETGDTGSTGAKGETGNTGEAGKDAPTVTSVECVYTTSQTTNKPCIRFTFNMSSGLPFYSEMSIPGMELTMEASDET